MTVRLTLPPSILLNLPRRFAHESHGNVAVIFALAIVPIISVAGMAIDYTMATQRQAQLSAISDAAALQTTSPAMMALPAATAQANALNMFNSQVATLKGTSVTNVTITVTDSTASVSTKTRVTKVVYSGTSTDAFSGLLHIPTLPIGGTSSATNSASPNIDFYLLLDTSPSMAIPSTTLGIQQMIAATPKQDTADGGGCAFACHQSNLTTSDTTGNPKGMDNYALAGSLNIELRIDEVKKAAANLFATALSLEQTNGASYRAATYTFDETFQNPTPLTTNLSTAATQALNNVNLLEVTSNSIDYSGKNNDDMDTQWDQAMANSTAMPNPGQGTNKSGDTPQEVLFIVTDGVFDEPYPGVGNTTHMVNTSDGRTIGPEPYQYDWCTPLKNRNIRIAVLYTTYNPINNNSYYVNNVSPWQPTIPNAMQACASPGLFFQVNTDGDINAAMQALFAKAVASAYLTQ